MICVIMQYIWLTNFDLSYVKCHNGNVISRKKCPSQELYWKKALNVSKNFVYVFLTHPLCTTLWNRQCFAYHACTLRTKVKYARIRLYSSSVFSTFLFLIDDSFDILKWLSHRVSKCKLTITWTTWQDSETVYKM